MSSGTAPSGSREADLNVSHGDEIVVDLHLPEFTPCTSANPKTSTPPPTAPIPMSTGRSASRR